MQVTLVHFLAIRNAEPSLVFVAVIWYALRADPRRALVYALCAGLLEDAVASQTGAAFTISTFASTGALLLVSRGFFADSFPLVLTLTVAVSLLRSLIFWTVMAAQGYPPGLSGLHFHEAVLTAVFNALVMLAVMALTRRYSSRYA